MRRTRPPPPASSTKRWGGGYLAIGPCIWIRHTEFTWGDWFVSQDEHTFLVPTPERFEPVVMHPDQEPIVGGGWFDPGDLPRRPRRTVYPEDLATHLADLLRDGPPSTPIRLPDSIG